MIWCCNELNAGYAADGFARKQGVGCCISTFCVGGFSLLNAIGGAYAEDLPVICISGGPNSNDYAANHVLHHTTGDASDYGQQLRCFKEVTCHQVVIQHIEEAHRQVDHAISAALIHCKPVYIQVCCNIVGITHPSFANSESTIPFSLHTQHSKALSLEAAVRASVKVLHEAHKVVLLVGSRIRPPSVRAAVLTFAEKSEYAVAQMADAKGMFPETYSRFIGTYRGAVSWPAVAEIVESADLVLSVGCVWNDYSTVGYSLLLKPERMLTVADGQVTICAGATFGCIGPADFLSALAMAVTPNNSCWTAYTRMFVPQSTAATLPEGVPLTSLVMAKTVEAYLDSNTALISEVGDSWFNTQKMRLPLGCEYELQMRYGSIGWSVGCTMGYALACGPMCRVASAALPGTVGITQTEAAKRVLTLVGDGSFQMTAQEVSTMLRYSLTPIIILVNNGGYTIEVEIHDGPPHNNYNVVKNWDYTALIKAMYNQGDQGGKLWTADAGTEAGFRAALAKARELSDHLCFIVVTLNRNDCSKELLEWGSRVAAANRRSPLLRH
ncbi:hypothetical protein CEUSTIGMA_g4359.t1 [Chlamydomonas eustigma]|uniref:pyruvate decarboxylase n=1 Tax=Chlamydomonas eustigma TaxID=1157962 RepID=A0A250X1E4_9CHLO|nr:hypothetical protein CEUSTIGMA_g4359.t1 [Chlamydomonas eustigma]|eukprot:GAX76913.1 hypothetical protein CEUSTIGMA_g4359.t1 [Chlamydomonas eustigma]